MFANNYDKLVRLFKYKIIQNTKTTINEYLMAFQYDNLSIVKFQNSLMLYFPNR